MLKNDGFYNFKELVALLKEITDKTISDVEVKRRIDSNQLTPYLYYKGAAHLTERGFFLNGIDYVADLFEEEFYVSGIFKLDKENIFLSEFCLEANLGVGYPVAQKIKIYSISNEDLKNIGSTLGYCLYNTNDKVNEKHSKTDLKCEIVFDKEELLDIASEYKNKQRKDYLENELEEARKHIEHLKRGRNLLEVEIDRLKKDLRATQPQEPTENLNDVKDSVYRLIFVLKDIILGLDQESKVLSTEKKNKINFVNQSEIVDYITTKEIPKLSKSNIEKIFTEANKRSLD